ncbi:MAG: ABC transporter ATP-binding protein, partial [Lachnospiraceae bacterium]|nr:ABC transporter ATP-binding protein [Lachnospiraceae bacterium]
MAGRNTYYQDEVINRRIDMRQLVKVLGYIRPYRGIFLFVVVLMIASSTASMLTPILLKRIIDAAIPQHSYRILWTSLGGMAALAAMEITVTWIHQRYMGIIGHEAIASIRRDAFYKLQRLPFDYFDSRPNGKIVVRVTDYVNDLANFFTNHLVMLLIYLVKIVMATVFMLSLSRVLTGVVFAAVLPMIVIVMLLRYAVRRLFSVLRAKNSNRAALIVESIMGEKVIKNYNRTAESREIYARIHDESLRVWLSIVRLSELNSPTVMSFWNFGTLLLYGLSLSMILSGSELVGAGTVVAFTNYMTQFSGPLSQIAMIIQQLAQVSSNLEQVFDLIDQPVSIDDEADSVELSGVSGRVDYHDVCLPMTRELISSSILNCMSGPGRPLL